MKETTMKSGQAEKLAKISTVIRASGAIEGKHSGHGSNMS